MTRAGTTGATIVVVSCLALAACSAIVDGPGNQRLACEPAGDEPDHCPGSQVCVDGFCEDPSERCADAPDGGTGAPDLCNEIDDDCDGVVDEGRQEECNGEDDDCDGTVDEGHDLDGDGFTWCGSGDMSQQDCDDNDPNSHPAGPDGDPPAAREVCDNVDNDCDRTVDEEPEDGTICEGSEICAGDDGCVPPDCTVTGCDTGVCDVSLSPPDCVEGTRCSDDGDCDAEENCDTSTGSCVTPQPLGSDCSVDAECDSGVCTSGEALALPSAGKICVEACCSSADCSDDAVCWVPGTGARGCVPGDMVGVTPGSGGPGESCGNGSECRSGLCFSDGGCLAHCTSHSQCGGDCTLVRYETNGQEIDNFVCGAGGDRGFGDSCSDHSDCRSGLCLGAFDPRCSRPCGRAGECPDVDFWRPEKCLPIPGGETSFNACVIAAGVEEPPLCCHDSQCTGECRAVARSGGRWEMHCSG